jgi:hypothetical protein
MRTLGAGREIGVSKLESWKSARRRTFWLLSVEAMKLYRGRRVARPEVGVRIQRGAARSRGT